MSPFLCTRNANAWSFWSSEGILGLESSHIFLYQSWQPHRLIVSGLSRAGSMHYTIYTTLHATDVVSHTYRHGLRPAEQLPPWPGPSTCLQCARAVHCSQRLPTPVCRALGRSACRRALYGARVTWHAARAVSPACDPRGGRRLEILTVCNIAIPGNAPPADRTLRGTVSRSGWASWKCIS